MPLLDHFHPPLSQERHWESFPAAWIGSIADALNRVLPAGYCAEERVHAGPGVETDVASFEAAGAEAPAAAAWSPPDPALTVPAVFADDFDFRVFADRGGPTLVAAVELVGPGNKDRPEVRRAFATKCASYLHQGVSLLLVDVMTSRSANLHNETMGLLQPPGAGGLPPDAGLYAVAYRPVRRADREEIDAWPATLSVGAALPTLPLALNAALSVPVDLEAACVDACRRRRLAS